MYKICVIVLISVSLVNGAQRNPSSSGVKDRSDSTWDPCRPINVFERKSKVEVAAQISKAISSCGFKLLSKGKIPLVKHLIEILPKLFQRACVICVVAYNRYSISPNRISPETAKNSSKVQDVFVLLIRGIQFAHRDEKNACVNLPPKRRLCYPVREIIDLLKDWVLCYLTTAGGGVPEYLEESLQLIQAWFNKAVSSGLIKYYVG